MEQAAEADIELGEMKAVGDGENKRMNKGKAATANKHLNSSWENPSPPSP